MSNNPAKTRADFWEEGPFCWNCEMQIIGYDDCDPDMPVYFCSPACREDFESRQPLQKFLAKRARKMARE